jgi:hypothetical protein
MSGRPSLNHHTLIGDHEPPGALVRSGSIVRTSPSPTIVNLELRNNFEPDYGDVPP